ncbi:hypothetical protein GF402_10710 [Candidatus Fermentibacteria bacterium]|nr:hypothetical protein [Candidatus Fermentibacteria bacterium]
MTDREMDRRNLRLRESGPESDKVGRGDLVGSWDLSTDMAGFLGSLPPLLAVERMRALARALVDARRRSATRLLMYGGHVIKCGLGPLLCDWIRRGVLSSLATNGAGTIHDLELAFLGTTSEDVESGIADGSFGMRRRTCELFSKAVEKAAKSNVSLGEALGRLVLDEGAFPDESPLACAMELGRPVSVHHCLGGDIVHPYPSLSWSDLGAAAEHDFDLMVRRVTDLKNGVVVNVGSAVVMPEVFLKALTTARNLGSDASDITAANLDMIQHYRPENNVVRRPTEALGGHPIQLTGHHELMLPLLDLFVRVEEKRDA